MTRKSLLTIFIFFAAIASFWFFSLKKDVKETQEMLSDQQAAATSARNPASIPVVVRDANTTSTSTNTNIDDRTQRRNQAATDLQNLSNQLSDERQRLQARGQLLNTLKSRQSQVQPVSYVTQIQERDDQIQDLMDGVRSFNRAETDLSRRAALALQNQNASERAARDQLDENIRTQEELIRQTQEQLDYWNLNFNYAVERQTHLDELQPLLQAQMDQLQAMRNQRLALSQDALRTTASVQDEVQGSNSDNSEQQNAMLDEIASLRDEIRAMQAQQNQSRMSYMTLNSQISQAQKDYNTQATQVQNLEEAVRQKQTELQSLQ